MPLYDYRCNHCGDFEERRRIADRKWGVCPRCFEFAPQVITHAPNLDIEGMADAGCPGAFETSGDRMTKRHLDADRAGDWASRDSVEFGDSAGVDRKEEFLKNAKSATDL
jgi:putative FmdB family regulatory protein